MKKIKILTPENIEVEYTLADLGSRTAAAVIDTFLQLIIVIALIIPILIISQFSPLAWELYYGWIVGISLLIYGLVAYGYFIIMELTMNGQTLGKKALKLRTIRNNGQPITLKHSAIRNLFRVFIDIFGVGVVLIFLSKEKKRLGDLVASTIVVMEGRKGQPMSLNTLTKMDSKLNYYLSQEEQQLLREYMERKDQMEKPDILREELKEHFTKRFNELGVMEEGKDFLAEL